MHQGPAVIPLLWPPTPCATCGTVIVDPCPAHTVETPAGALLVFCGPACCQICDDPEDAA